MTQNNSKVAFVIGAGRGIGLATCKQLAASGYTIAASSRSIDSLGELKAELDESAAEYSCHELNIADTEAVHLAVKDVVAQHGRIDALVNSAGISYVAPVALANIEKCQDVLQTNLMGAFIISKAVARIMTRQKSGRIVHIGSISGSIGAAYNAIYAASKAGVAGLVKSMALEVGSLGITVNAIQPGTVYTELFEQTHGARAKLKGISLEEQKTLMENDSPQGRLVLAEEIAAAVDYLLSDGAASVNGHLLTIDGGRSIK